MILRLMLMRTISSCLITVALVAGMVGCTPGPVQYDLTISSTEGGELVTPSEATSTYDEGTAVTLVVFPHTGYHFVNSTGDVGTIANVSTASTAITMNDNYSITANFAFQCLPMVDGGHLHTAGLKFDGAVVATGLNNYGQCNVGNWTDIVQVAADDYHTVGLKSDGTVVTVERNYYGECDVDPLDGHHSGVRRR